MSVNRHFITNTGAFTLYFFLKYGKITKAVVFRTLRKPTTTMRYTCGKVPAERAFYGLNAYTTSARCACGKRRSVGTEPWSVPSAIYEALSFFTERNLL